MSQKKTLDLQKIINTTKKLQLQVKNAKKTQTKLVTQLNKLEKKQ